MREELDNKLCAKYPKIFRDRSAPMNQTCMCWGFDHGDGWYNIIDQMCANIQHHIDWKNKQSEVVAQVTVNQIKEKFGGLRFYYSGGDDVIDGMVRMAESWAAHICEEFGALGKIRGGGWIRTLCDTHEAERQQHMKERLVE